MQRSGPKSSTISRIHGRICATVQRMPKMHSIPKILIATLSQVLAVGLPRLGCIGAKEPADSLSIELVLVAEMTIETPSRQTGILHDFVDGDLGEPVFVEEALSRILSRVSRLCSGE